MFTDRLRSIALVVLLAAVSGCAGTFGGPWHGYRPRPAPPVATVDVSIFYDDFAPYGHWFVYGSYGWVWTPYDVPYGWRPYTHGHWVYSDYGWTWVSHWRWGWGPFHYGRWMFDAEYGWIWIPDTVWGPAWVVWRWSDDWVGWAPLPPAVGWQTGVGLRFGDPHPRWDLHPSWWSFTQPSRLFDREVRYKLASPYRNGSLIERTRVVADYDEFEGRPRNRGRDIGEFEKLLRRPVERFHVVDAADPMEAEKVMDRGALQAYRPALAPAPAARPKAVDRQAPVITPDAERVRREREARKVDAFYEQERSRLKARQRTEIRQAPPGAVDQLLRRHKAEQRALEEQQARERKVRDERIEKRIDKPAPEKRRGSQEPSGQRTKKR